MITSGALKVERWRPEESAAAAYLRRNHILLHGSCITTIGQFACEPYLTLDTKASDQQIGTALLSVLAAALVASPPDLAAEREKIFAAAGVRSWKRFYAGTRHCFVSATPERITIGPSMLKRGAFVGLRDADIILDTPVSPEQLGGALRVGFSRCGVNAS